MDRRSDQASGIVAAGRLIALIGNWSAGRGALHVKLARRLGELIGLGDISPDVRLPPERPLAVELAVSRTTVAAAYERLREEGLVERRRGSGTWVRRPSRPDRCCDAGAFNPLFLQLLDGNPGRIDLTCAAPTPSGELAELLDEGFAAAAQAAPSGIGYFPAGVPELREAIAARYCDLGVPTRADEVVVTSGAQQALSLLAQLLARPGDVVGVEEFTYPGALEVFAASGLRVRAVRLGSAGADVEELEELIVGASPRLIYLVPTFQNPTGSVMPAWARRRLMRAVEARGVRLIDDQVLAELAFEGANAIPGPLASYGEGGSVLSVGSLSKLVWGGLRVGWIRGDRKTAAELARLKAIVDLGSDVLSQMVAVRLFARLESVIATRRRELRECCNELLALLREQLPGCEFEVPAGGQTLWVRLPGFDTRRFAQVALRHGVAVLEESSVAAGRSAHEHLRIPLTLPIATLREAALRLGDAWRAYDRATADRRMPATPAG